MSDSHLLTCRSSGVDAHHEHPAYLRHHFVSVEQQQETASFGMWLFLLTEIMFFGGLFTAYLIYRNWYYPSFCCRFAYAQHLRRQFEHAGAHLSSSFHDGHGCLVR